jgi:Mn2+/Fe2+ NRAMP family transporter
MTWTMLLTAPLMGAVQIICAQIARVTGKGLAANLSSFLPRWLLLPLLLMLFVSNAVNIGADLAAMGEATALLLPGTDVGYAVAFGIGCSIVLIVVPYSRYVWVLRWLSASLLAYVLTVFVIDVPWRKVAVDTLLPSLRWDKAYLQMFVAVLGTTISPYLFFWQSAQEIEEQQASKEDGPLKSHPEQAARQLHELRLDTSIGAAASNLIGFFIMVTAAFTLGQAGHHDIDSAAKAAEALRPIAGDGAFMLFAAGIVGTGLLAIPVLAASGAYALAESIGWRRGLELKVSAAPAFYATIAVATVIGIALPLSHVNAMHALVWASMANGVIAVPILIAVMLAARSRKVMKQFRIGPVLSTLGWATVALMLLALVGMLM